MKSKGNTFDDVDLRTKSVNFKACFPCKERGLTWFDVESA